MPVMLKGQAIGLLYADSEKPDGIKIDAEQLGLLRTLARPGHAGVQTLRAWTRLRSTAAFAHRHPQIAHVVEQPARQLQAMPGRQFGE